MLHIALKAQGLQGLVCVDEGQRTRNLIALAALNAHKAVLNEVKAAITVLAGNLVHIVENIEIRLLNAVDGAGNALLEGDLNIARLIGSSLGVVGHGVDISRRSSPGILQHAALNSAAPHVVVNGIRRLLGGGNLHAVSLCPLHLLRTGLKLPLTDRGNNLDGGIKHHDGGLEAHLIVALAGATMSDVLGAVLMRDIHQILRDERTGKRRKQRILVLVQRVGVERAIQVVLGELLTHVDDKRLDGTRAQRLLANGLKAVMLLTNLANYRDDIKVLLLLQPLDAHRRVKAARICQYALFPLLCHDVRFPSLYMMAGLRFSHNLVMIALG